MTDNKVVLFKSLESSIKIWTLTLDVCIFCPLFVLHTFGQLSCFRHNSHSISFFVFDRGIFPAHCTFDEKETILSLNRIHIAVVLVHFLFIFIYSNHLRMVERVHVRTNRNKEETNLYCDDKFSRAKMNTNINCTQSLKK